MNAVKVFLIVLAILLFPGITSAQVLSITYQTIPETPIPGDVFALQINIVNSGHAVKDVKLSVSEREDDLSIISDGEKLSYLTINVGDITGSVSTAVKLKAEKEGTFQLRIKLSYDYGAGSFEEVIPIIVMDRPSLNVESVSHPVIEPDSTGKWVFDVVNSGGEAKNVITGVYSGMLVLSYTDRLGNEYREESKFAIMVEGHPEISFSGFSTDPERVYPDSAFILSLSVENTGKEDAKNVMLILSYPESFSGERQAFLGTLKRGENASVDFKLKADRTAESGSYPFRLTVKYLDGKTVRKKNFNFSLFIDELGSISLNISGLYFSPIKVTPSSDFTLSLQIENAGKQDAKAVAVKLILPEGFEGKNQYFIGTLESGDSATSTFDLTAPEKTGEYTVKAKITYMDSRMEKYSVEKEFTIYVFPGESSTLGIGITAALLLVAAGGYLWRRKAK